MSLNTHTQTIKSKRKLGAQKHIHSAVRRRHSQGWTERRRPSPSARVVTVRVGLRRQGII